MLDKETVTIGGLTRTLDRFSDSLLRAGGLQLGTAADPDADEKFTYVYDNAGRLHRVSQPKTHFRYHHNYTYAPGSAGLVSSVGIAHKVKNNGNSYDATAIRRIDYEPGRDAIDRIGTFNLWGTDPAASYDHHEYTA